MASRKKEKVMTDEDYCKAFFLALNQLAEERKIDKDILKEKIRQGLATAYKRDHPGVGDNLNIIFDEENQRFAMSISKDVVETVDKEGCEISLEEARKSLPHAQLGDVVNIRIQTRGLNRIAAQSGRQVIVQGIREAERQMVYDRFESKKEEIITGTVTSVASEKGISVRIGVGEDNTEAFLSKTEMVPGESYQVGDVLKVFVVNVRNGGKGPQILISRTHFGLVRRLFELEVPEIFDGTVEVKNIAREAGSRTKMAVDSQDPNVDAIGACVGNRGERVNAIVNELKGEKVDIVLYSEDPAEFIAAALAPAKAISVEVLPEGKSCRVVVPDDQLSLAIGKEGQNARLAARLTGYKIDIKAKSVADSEAAARQQADLLEEDLLAD